MRGQKNKSPLPPRRPSPRNRKTRPVFWVNMLVLMGLVFLLGLGQWDLALAVLLGLAVGNGLLRIFP